MTTLVLYSRLAFYPVHWRALEEIVRRYDVRAVVLAAASPADLPTVHQAHGSADPVAASGLPIEVRRVPAGSRRSRLTWIARQLRAIGPDAVWVQEEPIDPFLLEMLAIYRFAKRPRIATAVCENIFPRAAASRRENGAPPPLAAARPSADRRAAVARRNPRGRDAGIGPGIDSRRGWARAGGRTSHRWHCPSIGTARSSSASPGGSSRRRDGRCSPPRCPTAHGSCSQETAPSAASSRRSPRQIPASTISACSRRTTSGASMPRSTASPSPR